ncbi:MAG: hypothetical protein CVU38_20835 [Chloroflexi bacterium HGW-Chloroflexi-1]|nr:MAG: hypothetical protein CVU38_20835 [Chloroflexi bacterium HGW-Chloroflexi-1]
MEAKPRYYVNDLANLTEPHHVLLIGSICPEWVAGIADLTADNLELVLTQPRLQYIRSKADGRIRFLDLALQAVLDPDEVHRNRHPNNAIFYKRLGPRGYLKVVVWLQREKTDRQHSIGDFYPRDAVRVERARGAMLVWRKA